MPLLNESDLPAPRLELRWRKIGKSWIQRECAYNLVIPLQTCDVRRDDKGSETLTVPFSATKVTGGNGSPLHLTGPDAGEIEVPFRDSAHAKWDASSLGDLPIYAIAEGKAQLVSDPAKKENA